MKTLIKDALFDAGDLETSKLKEVFGIPPFSIFDTTSGDWIKRRNEWKRLGIKSELGRGDNLLFKNETVGDFDNNRNQSNFGKCNPAIGEAYGRKIQETSIFDPVICELIYTWFMPKDKTNILDCFAGGSVRGVVASVLGKDYTGIDLRKEQIDANIFNFEQIKEKCGQIDFKNVNWICGDSINIKNLAGDKKYDLLFSCPPYYDLEVYSENKNDLSNLSNYDDFLKLYQKIIIESCSLLNDNRFAYFVVSEIRDKNGVYRNFVGDTVKCFQSAGLQYYNEIILVNSCGSLPVRIKKQFNSGRKIGRRHQNILIFYKGDVKKIKDNFSEVVIEN